MESTIIGEDEKDIGTKVTDNNGVVHQVEMHKKNGKIYAHEQDGYPDDPPKRTNREDEMVAQVREYAKWHVYREREYDTLPPRRNPDRIAATLATVREMDDAEFERHFGTLVQQFRSYGDNTVDRPIELEDAVPHEEGVVYKQDVYLDATIEDVRGYHEEFADGAESFATAVVGRLQEAGVFGMLGDRLGGFLESDGSNDVASQSTDTTPSEHFRQFGFAHVSEPYYMYHRTNKPARTVGGEDDDQRAPDTVIEVIPTAAVTESLDVFRAFLVHHLLCQIRDTYIGMGVEPPAAYRMLGAGIHHYTIKYKHFEMYPEYFDTDAEIDGYGYY
ncbi:hypothetical protein [Natrinema sp. J7-1]|uniref:hypothetical protein n=1 Tax=Natrinema sp. J7-1 TaxID=1172566 RepID=UPI0006779534|nr:hypothetical protein [Natrinema sp. J7-1]